LLERDAVTHPFFSPFASSLMPMPSTFLPIVWGIILSSILLEASWVHRRHRSLSWKECMTSFGVALGYRITNGLFSMIPMTAFTWAWEHRLWTISLNHGWSILLLFLGIEFFYYWHHRAAHEIRWLWATHAVHHSSRHLNLSAAYRLGWTGWLSGNFLFFMPLCWLGFHPIKIMMGLALNLTYQFWIHTELIPKLGRLEWILNTPSHHRVHHASNPHYIDRNYGGVLIIFDRWFGTFQVEQPHCPPVYGLTHPFRSYNPVTVAFHEWGQLVQDFKRASTWGDLWGILFGRPS
jgi:sterol desaturase/sphingolipid hydroxylase (fatty acid hydroxylase superfamily)